MVLLVKRVFKITGDIGVGWKGSMGVREEASVILSTRKIVSLKKVK